jgi:RNA polymerase sigma-70 factor (ECF subfamily)
MNPAPAAGSFPTTHWTLVARIKSPDESIAAGALDELCAQYHYPLYCYLRRRGCAHHDSQDVLHDFLAGLLRLRALERLEEVRGRLRGYLATSLGRHLHDWRRSEARRCNVGSMSRSDDALVERTLHSMVDFEAVADRYQRERFSDADTPDRVFDRKWALELLRQVIDRLATHYERRGRGALFVALRPVLEGGGTLRGEDSHALATSVGLSDEALRAALARLLRQFRDEMQAEVRLTVEHPEEVPDELTYLQGLFRR